MAGNCFLCGEWHELETHHLLEGTGKRKLCDEDGLTIEICSHCHRAVHDSGWMYHELHEQAEIQWLNQDWNRSIQDFVNRYGKNYLWR